MKKILSNLFVALIASLCGFMLLEIGIRSLGYWDENNQFYFNEQPVMPYQIPLNQINLNGNKTDGINNRAIYDENIGWTNNPNFVPSGGINALYKINKGGMRDTQEYEQTPPDDTLRIALFGDSFTFGGEVQNDETWSHHLTNILTEKGIRVEVLNFGVSGYGMDQAYLRWKYDGILFQPDIVIFGFSPFDLRRNTNLFRGLADLQTSLTKPRFIMDDNNLTLIHQPATPPEEVQDVLTNFYLNPLSQYEGYYDSRFSQHWWLESKTIALIANYLNPPPQERSIGSITEEETELAERIILKFGSDVSEEDSQFIIMHLPGKIHLEYFLRKGALGYYPILENIAEQYPVLYLESVLSESKSSYWRPQTHYSDSLNQLLAEFTANQLIDCIDNKSCFPKRFNDITEFSKP